MLRRTWAWIALGLLAPAISNAAYLYSFTGVASNDDAVTTAFSFTSPTLITGTGPVAIDAFSFGGATYTQGYFGSAGGSPCFAFATANVGSGNLCGFGDTPAGEPYAFTYSVFVDPTSLGTHLFTTFVVGASGLQGLVVTRLTISETRAVPEPDTLALLAFGLLGVGIGTRAKRR